ncbi:MAG TPA: hypothetical protein VEB19_10090 [Gemmatimonadaceae bacterium]|nr:hypothetical protein [Gemmatimonadaceae bacterium]
MRVRTCLVALSIVCLGGSASEAQQAATEVPDRVSFDVASGLSRYGPHAITGLEYSMNRWLAARADVIFGLQNWTNDPNPTRLTAVSLAGVLSTPEKFRITPYLLAGYGVSASQGFRPELGPLVGGGLRLNFGRFKPYVETRVQNRVGVPISIGVRF